MKAVGKNEFATWLDNHFLDWQKSQGGSRTLKEFAAYLGVVYETVTQYMSGRRKPDAESLDPIAYKLNDLSCYALLGFPTPDPLLLRLKIEWDTYPEETRADIEKMLEKAEAEEKIERGTEVPKPFTPKTVG